MSDRPASPRTKVRRHPERGRYERGEVEAILDAGFYGHLAFVLDEQPYALPMLYVRNGDQLFLHGSVKSRLIGAAGEGARLCFTVTLIDGLVMARAAFTHSVNYRSVVVLGQGRPVRERAEKLQAMDLLVEHIIPGRTSDARQANTNELKATQIIALSIDEASAKVRAGGPVDKDADLDMPIWTGVLPLRLSAGEPITEAGAKAPVPDYVRARLRG